MSTGKKRYEYRGTMVNIDDEHKEEFICLMKRGVLISLHKDGVLSISQLEQCLNAIEVQSR